MAAKARAQPAWMRMENCVKPGVLRSHTMDCTRGTVSEKYNARNTKLSQALLSMLLKLVA